MVKYSIDIVENGLKEILNGNISATPIKGACEFCKNKAICAIDTLKIVRPNDQKVEPKDFVEVHNE